LRKQVGRPLLSMQNTRQVHQVRSFGGGHLARLLVRSQTKPSIMIGREFCSAQLAARAVVRPTAIFSPTNQFQSMQKISKVCYIVELIDLTEFNEFFLVFPPPHYFIGIRSEQKSSLAERVNLHQSCIPRRMHGHAGGGSRAASGCAGDVTPAAATLC
jgi:hypothetical protein